MFFWFPWLPRASPGSPGLSRPLPDPKNWILRKNRFLRKSGFPDSVISSETPWKPRVGRPGSLSRHRERSGSDEREVGRVARNPLHSAILAAFRISTKAARIHSPLTLVRTNVHFALVQLSQHTWRRIDASRNLLAHRCACVSIYRRMYGV